MSEKTCRIAIAQCNVCVGAIEDNTVKIISWIERAKEEHQADVVIFPELVVTGYPPEDILLREELYQRVNVAMEGIAEASKEIYTIVGHPILTEDNLIYNAATLCRNGELVKSYCKRILPNYGVFDEARYFTPLVNQPVFELDNLKLGIMICEDGWSPEVSDEAARNGADILIQLNASPFRVDKIEERMGVAAERVAETNLPMINVQMVGGQDALVFDGTSFLLDRNGDVLHQLPSFEESLSLATFTHKEGCWLPEMGQRLLANDPVEQRYRALVLAVRDYVQKNNFSGALIGLSGGVDSAVTLAIAVDALGPENVRGVLMPSQFTLDMSNEDAMILAGNLGVETQVVPIEPVFESFKTQLADAFKDQAEDVTEENLQSRIRGTLLMALSNKFGQLVLCTGNKSEVAVGYSTLYGDSAGAFDVLKDVYKTQVYELAKYRNTLGEDIPERILLRAPSAELRQDQTDQDSLPDYEILDGILMDYIEEDMDAISIAAKGFDIELVNQIITLVKQNEYKRRQSPLGPKLTPRAFDKDWRYPITSKF